MENSEYHYLFQYVESIGHAEVNGRGRGSTQIPLKLLFSPKPDAYLGGKLLGQGWWFPAFESTLLQTNARTYTMALPNGQRVRLEKEGGLLKGDGWSGTVGDRETVLKTKGGWSTKFQQGRLVEMVSPARERYQFTIARDGVRTITYNGHVVLTLTRKIDEKTTFPVYFVSYTSQGKSQKAELRMGQRPVFAKYVEKVNDRNVTKEREDNADTLSSVKLEGQEEKKYNFGLTSLDVAKKKFKWDKKTARLVEADDKKYAVVKIRDGEYLATTTETGTSIFGGLNDTYVSQQEGGPIGIAETFELPAPKQFEGKPKAVYFIDGSGKEVLWSQFSYDDQGNVIKLFFLENGKERYFLKNEKMEMLRDANKQILWRKEFDKSGRLVKFEMPPRTYAFSYISDKQIEMSVISGGEKKTKRIPVEKLEIVLQKLENRQ